MYHKGAMIAVQTFKESVENPSNIVTCLFDKEREERIKESREIVKSIARAVLFCGRHCIALRGHREKLNQSENPGNCSTLEARLQTAGSARVTYISPQSQNEMIDVIGKHYLQKKLVKEILESRYYAILADEGTISHNEEKLSIVIRFVDATKILERGF